MIQDVLVKEIKYVGLDEAIYKSILTNDAKVFLIKLHEQFNNKRLQLLEEREIDQAYFDMGNYPSFPSETKEIRDGDWVCAKLPTDLLDRRVEITGPVDRKMVINALNSGAKTFMADFEDSSSPTISNLLEGQINLRDAVNKSISFYNEKKGKSYQLNEETATLLVRPRGLHLNEKHFLIDEVEMSGSLIDFGLFFFHNINTLLEQGSASIFLFTKIRAL